jgi:XTP/dITP diphosphohydrolase
MAYSQLVIATHNRGKVIEYRDLLKDIPVALLSLGDVGIEEDVEETGTSFEENAWLKASTYSRLSGLLTLSDDSGLEVDALGREPGIYTARYGGEQCANFEERVRLLLRNLEDVPWERRTARFKCVMAVSGPEGRIGSVVGSVAGMIKYQPAGTEGFGFDPVFYLPSYGRTMAQLTLTEKNAISHRSDATRKARAVLARLTQEPPAN